MIGGLLVIVQLLQQFKGSLAIFDIVEDLPKHPTKTYQRRNLSRISKIIIHHSTDPNGDPYKYANFHIGTRDWPAISYHYVIQKSGEIYRTNYLSTLSFHARNCNTVSVGVCLTGNYEVEQVPEVQLQACIQLIQRIQRELGRSLSIEPHHNCTDTRCPGQNMPLQQIISSVNSPA